MTRHVAVIGGGIVGTCTAWYLGQHGFEVTVFERRDAVARETSWGNAGVVAPAYVMPWAAPGMPRKVLSYLFAAEAPVLFRPVASAALARWLAAWLGQCTLERYRLNKSRMQRLAFYSRDQLHSLRATLHIDDGMRQGYLQLMRSQQDLAMAAPAIAMLQEAGVPHRLLDAAACRQMEPALSVHTPLAGALHLPQDESASCPAFAQGLADAAIKAGVRFAFGHTVTRIRVEDGRATSLEIERAPGERAPGDPAQAATARQARSERAEHLLQRFDAVVVAGAVDSLPLLAEHRIRLPIWPVKGYSTSLPLPDPALGPRQAMIDEAYKVAITPLPGQIRLAGTAEIGSPRLVPRDAALRTLVKVGRDWFPTAADWASASCWVGARPMTPDGPALLGATPVGGLFINMGHGSTGWAMACGAGKVVADLVAGLRPEIDLDGLTIERLAR
ncbi:MAG: FAD-dependent oxidoreductase [Burkholderiales bacterium]|nr:FAD-dependent oxidoreductase [Burkholderiales bacterium]